MMAKQITASVFCIDLQVACGAHDFIVCLYGGVDAYFYAHAFYSPNAYKWFSVLT